MARGRCGTFVTVAGRPWGSPSGAGGFGPSLLGAGCCNRSSSDQGGSGSRGTVGAGYAADCQPRGRQRGVGGLTSPFIGADRCASFCDAARELEAGGPGTFRVLSRDATRELGAGGPGPYRILNRDAAREPGAGGPGPYRVLSRDAAREPRAGGTGPYRVLTYWDGLSRLRDDWSGRSARAGGPGTAFSRYPAWEPPGVASYEWSYS